MENNRKIDAAYTSPLSRAKETAEIVTEPHGISPTIHDGFIDMDYGEWTGKKNSEVAKSWPNEHTAWITNPHTVRPPGGTTLKEIFEKSFLIFSHRVVNKLLVLGALSLGLERFPFIIQGNCCINEIARIQTGYLIESINDVSHIKNAGTDLLQADF